MRVVTRVGTIARGDDDHAELVLGQGGQLGGETVNGAAVADAPLAVQFADDEAEAEAFLRPRA